MTLFDLHREQQLEREAPLAARMRPRCFAEFVGQEHIVGEGRVLRKAIEQDLIPSMIFWGPPGSGKTTLAFVIAAVTSSHFSPISAVSAAVADLRRVVEEAKTRRGMHGQRTILFIDEIHRFNKAQQDAVLPHVENGTITMIGATTENPSFEVISALLSRCRVFTLNMLTDEQIGLIIQRALEDRERGLGEMRVEVAEDALRHLIAMSNGDARISLSALEMAALTTAPDDLGVRHIELGAIEDALQHRALRYDKSGEEHYNLISALHKSLRGSDPDAALYWLGRMLEAGEDPLYIARRLVRFASEDVGLADPQALVQANAAQQAVHFIGMPEGNLALAQAVVYLAAAPKSNSLYKAYSRVQADVEKTHTHPVPLHLRNPVTHLMREIGYGKGYEYAHDFPGHFVKQQNLPDALEGRKYYEPSDQGFEREIEKRNERRD
ncbi:replication-associated recombination protein A [Dehalococcoidia bacterium]|nr:replication-associated recombination protein A [Dehalococcoidia bacterium]MCL0065188.1 replication-associated recombination protein A [Dehalococcoidia bacterium]